MMYHCGPDGIWSEGGEQRLREALHTMCPQAYTVHLKNEVMDRVKATTAVDREAFGPPPQSLPVGNGLLDMEDEELRDIEPNDYIRWRLPVDYDPDADCEEFRSFLGDVAPADKLMQLQEMVGYGFHHSGVPFKKALMLLGPTDAGKSVFLRVVEALYGDDNTANLSVQYLTGERWGVAQLEGRPVNVRHEINNDMIENASVLKELVSGNSVQAERKGKPVYWLEPNTKHYFSGNRVPDRDMDDDAFWNRWLTVIFPESVPESEQDPMLSKRLTEPETISGVLNWALEGYQRLMENGQFTNEPQPWENRQKWSMYGDTVDRFVERKCETDPDVFEETADLYEAYTRWAKRNNMEVEPQQTFTKQVKQNPDVSQTQRRLSGGRVRVYIGIRLEDRDLLKSVGERMDDDGETRNASLDDAGGDS